MRIFLEKDVKIVSASPPTVTTCSSSFLALNAVYYLQKRTNFACSKFLQLFFTSNSVAFVDRGRKNISLFFTSNSVAFVDRGRKNISCPRAQGTLATPLPAVNLADRAPCIESVKLNPLNCLRGRL